MFFPEPNGVLYFVGYLLIQIGVGHLAFSSKGCTIGLLVLPFLTVSQWYAYFSTEWFHYAKLFSVVIGLGTMLLGRYGIAPKFTRNPRVVCILLAVNILGAVVEEGFSFNSMTGLLLILTLPWKWGKVKVNLLDDEYTFDLPRYWPVTFSGWNLLFMMNFAPAQTLAGAVKLLAALLAPNSSREWLYYRASTLMFFIFWNTWSNMNYPFGEVRWDSEGIVGWLGAILCGAVVGGISCDIWRIWQTRMVSRKA